MKIKFQTITHTVVILTMLLQSALPVLASTKTRRSLPIEEVSSPLGAKARYQTEVSPNIVNNDPALLSNSPLVEVVQQQVAELATHPNPEPVVIDEILPPGTLKHPAKKTGTDQTHASSSIFDIPLPESDDSAIELVELRSETSKIFQRPDGSGYAIVYLTPIHYQTTDGDWHELDPTLVNSLASSATPDEAEG